MADHSNDNVRPVLGDAREKSDTVLKQRVTSQIDRFNRSGTGRLSTAFSAETTELAGEPTPERRFA